MSDEKKKRPPRRSRRRKRDPIKYEIRGRDGVVRPAFVEDPITGCWISTAPSTGNGYRGSSGNPAHKDAYERLCGLVAEGSDCHHLCGNRECVNAEHIIALSRADHAKLHAFLRAERRRRADTSSSDQPDDELS